MIRHSLSCERLKQPISKPHKTVLMVEVVVAAAAVVVVVVEVVVVVMMVVVVVVVVVVAAAEAVAAAAALSCLSVCPSVHLSLRNNSAPFGRISMKFDV